uniref:ADP-ribose pyrophosphatase, mitochondrial n=1 Tax=Magallana gigas TaxID=29159 RepID=K1QAC0_MAGGI
MHNRGCMGNKATAVARLSPGMKPKCHIKARCEIYPRSQIKRFPVPDDKVPWTTKFPEYKPVDYTSESILKRPVYADPDIRLILVSVTALPQNSVQNPVEAEMEEEFSSR